VVGVGVDGVLDGDVLPLCVGDGLVADAVGDTDFDMVTVGVALVGGASCVGDTEVRLGVGLTDRAAVVCGAVIRLVPGAVLPAGVVRNDAVVGVPSFDGAAGEVAPFNATCGPLELSRSTATIAAIPHNARPIPAAAKRCLLRVEPPLRSEY
jgi:hypothetical protein